MEQILAFIGAVVVGGGGLGVIVYQIFKALGGKWLDQRFESRLQSLRHEHGKEIEQLRFKISALLDRTTKMHQREFEVLPEAWQILNDAYWATRAAVSLGRSYPDLSAMTPPQLNAFISKSQLEDWERDELQSAPDPNAYYQKRIDIRRLSDAKNQAQNSYTFTMKNGIFIEASLRQQFSALHDLIWDALIDEETNLFQKPMPRFMNRIRKLHDEGDNMMKALEMEIHDRIWPKETV